MTVWTMRIENVQVLGVAEVVLVVKSLVCAPLRGLIVFL